MLEFVLDCKWVVVDVAFESGRIDLYHVRLKRRFSVIGYLFDHVVSSIVWREGV